MHCVAYVAVNGEDYNSDPSRVAMFEFGDNLTSCIFIELMSDNSFEGREDFTVTITSADFGLSIGWPSTATVEIVDSDGNI